VFGKALRALLWLAILGHAALIVIVLFASIALLKVNPPITALMVYRRITTHEAARPTRFVPLRQIPPVLRNMVVRLEDMHFYQHAGVDLGALRDAWNINASIGWTAVGGSTIPMQLARNLFLTPRKTYFRKYLESIIALEMDLILPKSRLLELYLNCIEWGKGIFGIGAASVSSYGTAVTNLSLDEMRRMAAIITNPLRYNVNTFSLSRQMEERYLYLVTRFPDPAAEPADQGPVAPFPDEPQGTVAPQAQGAPAQALPAPVSP
jgi:monofunctional biosynthetic peptidoglycan transglycosylase